MSLEKQHLILGADSCVCTQGFTYMYLTCRGKRTDENIILVVFSSNDELKSYLFGKVFLRPLENDELLKCVTL